MTLSEQIIQCHLLVHILRMFITDCPARCHHHKLNRMCFRMPPAVHKRIYLMLQFQFIFPVNCEQMFTELHFTQIVCPFALPFQHQVYLRPGAVRSFSPPAIVPADGGNTQRILDLCQMPYAQHFKRVSGPSIESRGTLQGPPIASFNALPIDKVQIKHGEEILQLIDCFHPLLPITRILPRNAGLMQVVQNLVEDPTQLDGWFLSAARANHSP